MMISNDDSLARLGDEFQQFDSVNNVYHLYLKIYYKCKEGQSIAISGSIPALGDWKVFTELQRTNGDFWVNMEPIMSDIHFYRYKYVLFDSNQKALIQWERGIDRIADLGVLDQIDRIPGTSRIVHRTLGNKPLKSCELEDEWEEFTVEFTVNHPSLDF